MELRDPKCAVLRLTIEGVEPVIWRRVIVPRDWRLSDLHRVIQAAFGWAGAYAHEFILAGLAFSNSPTPAGTGPAELRIYDEDDVRLRDMIGRDVEFSYEYEMGEHWLVGIVLEDLLWKGEGPDGPRCIGGARAAPPEDSEGPEAYAALLDAMRDSGHPDHELVRRRLSSQGQWPYNPEAFDLDVVDRRVAKVAPPNARHKADPRRGRFHDAP